MFVSPFLLSKHTVTHNNNNNKKYTMNVYYKSIPTTKKYPHSIKSQAIISNRSKKVYSIIS